MAYYPGRRRSLSPDQVHPVNGIAVYDFVLWTRARRMAQSRQISLSYIVHCALEEFLNREYPLWMDPIGKILIAELDKREARARESRGLPPRDKVAEAQEAKIKQMTKSVVESTRRDNERRARR